MKNSMFKSFVFIFAVVFSPLVFLSCISVGADAQFAKSFSSSEKAEMLFLQGKSLYENDVLKDNDFSKIAEARSAFESALKINQYHPLAPIYMEKLDSYAKTNFDKYVSEAYALLEKEDRTSRENYTLLRDVKIAGDIDAGSKDFMNLRIKSMKIRSDFASVRTNRLKEIEGEIAAAESPDAIGKLAAEAEELFGELDSIGAYGSSEDEQRAVVEANLMRTVAQDMEKAEEHLSKRQYGDANKTVSSVEKNLGHYYSAPVPAVEDFKYRLYVKWVGALISVEAYNQADRTVDMAIDLNPTEEALAYKQQIALKLEQAGTNEPPRKGSSSNSAAVKADTGPDYDSEIKDICSEIDRLIAEDKMLEAWDKITEVKPALKLQSSISALEQREADIYSSVPSFYGSGIDAYNSEDYESAVKYFRIVVGINPDYEQARAYLDRATSRLKILSGVE